MQNTPQISARQIAEHLGLEVKSIEANIRALRKAGYIKREGARKTGRWIIT